MKCLATARYIHNAGTKFYDMLVLAKSGNEHFVVRRWGKTGTGGQIKIDPVVFETDAMLNFSRENSNRNKRGYVERPAQPLPASLAELRDWLSRSGWGLVNTEAVMNLVSDAPMETPPDDVVVIEPKPEINRGAEWGSW